MHKPTIPECSRTHTAPEGRPGAPLGVHQETRVPHLAAVSKWCSKTGASLRQHRPYLLMAALVGPVSLSSSGRSWAKSHCSSSRSSSSPERQPASKGRHSSPRQTDPSKAWNKGSNPAPGSACGNVATAPGTSPLQSLQRAAPALRSTISIAVVRSHIWRLPLRWPVNSQCGWDPRTPAPRRQ